MTPRADSVEVLLVWDSIIAAKGTVSTGFLEDAATKRTRLTINISPFGHRVPLDEGLIEYLVTQLREKRTLFNEGTRLEVRIG